MHPTVFHFSIFQQNKLAQTFDKNHRPALPSDPGFPSFCSPSPETISRSEYQVGRGNGTNFQTLLDVIFSKWIFSDINNRCPS